MTETLSPSQQRVLDSFPATATELANEHGVKRTTVYDYIRSIREHYDVFQNDDGQYNVLTEEKEGPTTIRKTTMGSSKKAARTREIRDFFDEFEDRLLGRLETTDPVRADGGMAAEPGNQDVVLYRTDDHFGAYEENQYGETVFDSSIAESRVKQHFDEALALKETREQVGTSVDTLNVLLGGDMVDGEGIYEGQGWHQDLGLGGQIEYVAGVYLEQIQRAAEAFDSVLVVCQGGNHGEIRVGGQSPGANADGFVFSSIDLALRHSSLDNVTLLRSDATKFVNFNMRGHNAHLRHGQGGLGHIGTSSGQQRWGSWLRHHNFDIAYRGHHHEVKVEPIDTVPVLMGGTLEPTGEFAEGLGIGEGRPSGILHTVSDTEALSDMEFVYFE